MNEKTTPAPAAAPTTATPTPKPALPKRGTPEYGDFMRDRAAAVMRENDDLKRRVRELEGGAPAKPAAKSTPTAPAPAAPKPRSLCGVAMTGGRTPWTHPANRRK